MPYLHQHMYKTGVNVFETKDDLNNFLLSLDGVREIIQQNELELRELEKEGILLSRKTATVFNSDNLNLAAVSLLGEGGRAGNCWKFTRIFSTLEQAEEYSFKVQNTLERMWETLGPLGWTIIIPRSISFISDERMAEIEIEKAQALAAKTS